MRGPLLCVPASGLPADRALFARSVVALCAPRPQPAAASLRERTDPAVIMLNEVDAEVRALVSLPVRSRARGTPAPPAADPAAPRPRGCGPGADATTRAGDASARH